MNATQMLCKPEVALNVMTGVQTQHRVVMRKQPAHGVEVCMYSASGFAESHPDGGCLCKEVKPPFQVGQVLWIRERARLIDVTHQFDGWYWKFQYEADGLKSGWVKWPDRIKEIGMGHCVPNGCFKELARTFVKVLEVGVEQIQDISGADIIAEGIKPVHGETLKPQFTALWDSLYPGSWDRNDWVWKIKFKLTDKPK